MKFAFKSIVVAAAFVAAGTAGAATLTAGNTAQSVNSWSLVSGSGALTFSPTLVDALNTGGVAVEAAGLATSDIEGVVKDYIAVGVTAPVTQLDVAANGVINTATSVGGATQTAAFKKGVSYGGTISVTNLKIDLVNQHIYADFVGAGKNAAGATVNVNATNVLAWTFSDNIGPTSLPGAAPFGTNLTVTNELSGLALTAEGFNYLKDGLGLYSIGLIALEGAAADFGTLNSSLTFTSVTAVPEPSTYALMGLGLVGIGFAARRRAAK